MKHLIILLLLCSCAPLPSKPQEDKALVFLLWGQSNIAGAWQDNTSELPGPEVTEVHRLPDWSFTQESTFKYPNHGPAANIGRKLAAKYPGRKIRILNLAAGGSSMTDWRQDQTGVLYPTMIQRLKDALANGDTLEAIFCLQGESDATNEAGYTPQPTIWAQNFTNLINNIKAQFGETKVVIGQIGTTTSMHEPNWQVVKDQQVLASELNNFPIIKTDDFTLSDDLHVDYRNFDELAKRFVEEL